MIFINFYIIQYNDACVCLKINALKDRKCQGNFFIDIIYN